MPWNIENKECVYYRRWGGRLKGFLCCHIWHNEELYKEGRLIIERNRCIECGRKEILILVAWGW